MDYPKLYPIIAFVPRGSFSKLFIFKKRFGKREVYKYYYPYNPRTELQQSNRDKLAQAVTNWQGFDQNTKNYYEERVGKKAMSGYNKYIGMYIKNAPNNWYNPAWGYRVKITIDKDKVEEDLTNFPVYINLADMPSEFWSNVKNGGGDIRITKANGVTEVAREIVSCNTSTETGEIYFNTDGTLSSTTDTEYYLYYGNSSADDYADSDTYGTYNTWNSNYKMVMHLEESSGNYKDSSGNSNNSTAIDIANRTATGKIGTCPDLEASNTESIIVADSDTLDPTQITISCFCTIESYPGTYPRIISKDGQTGGAIQQYQLVTHNNNKIWWRIKDSATWYGGDFDTGALTADGVTWHYLVGTYDGETLKAYLNGEPQTATYSHTGSINSGTDGMAIGTKIDDINNSAYLYDGKIDELRISNNARSAGYIKTEYNNLSSPSTFYTIE